MLVTLAALGSMGVAREVKACSPPLRTGWHVAVLGDVPADGAIVLTFICSGDCKADKPDFTVTVIDDEGEPVVGELVQSQFGEKEGWAAWVPAEHFERGSDYEIAVDSEQLTQPYEVQVQAIETASDVPSRDELDFTASAVVSTAEAVGDTQTDQVCCEEPALLYCGQEPCFTWPETGDVVVRLSVDMVSSPSQFVVRGEFHTRRETVPFDARPSSWMVGVVAPADRDDEYCYELTVQHVVTGKETTFSDCIPAHNVPLPDVMTELTQRREDDLRSCIVPPQEHQDAWCDAFADQIGTWRCTSDQCKNAAAVCPPRDSVSCAMAPTQPAPSHTWRFFAFLVVVGATLRRRVSSRTPLFRQQH